MANAAVSCDLCSLPVELSDFELETTSGRKRFCCEGCMGIYQMLHESEVISPSAGERPAAK